MNPLAMNPLLNPLNALNPLLFQQMAQNQMVSNMGNMGNMSNIYSDALGPKSQRNPDQNLDRNSNEMPKNTSQPRKRRRFHDNPRDALDPMNPSNPTYNFMFSQNDQLQSRESRESVPIQHIPHSTKPIEQIQPVGQTQHDEYGPPIHSQPIRKKKDEDITKMGKVERPLEVIMDPKLKALMPSSMRFKRKYAKPAAVRPVKKRKLDIAPDVDNVSGSRESGKEKSGQRDKSGYHEVNADAAYDKFMDEISGLI